MWKSSSYVLPSHRKRTRPSHFLELRSKNKKWRKKKEKKNRFFFFFWRRGNVHTSWTSPNKNEKTKTKMTRGIDPSTVAAIVTGRHDNGLDPLTHAAVKETTQKEKKSASHSPKVVVIIIIPTIHTKHSAFGLCVLFLWFQKTTTTNRTEPEKKKVFFFGSGSTHDVIVPQWVGWHAHTHPKSRRRRVSVGIDHNVTPPGAPPPPDKEKGITHTHTRVKFNLCVNFQFIFFWFSP